MKMIVQPDENAKVVAAAEQAKFPHLHKHLAPATGGSCCDNPAECTPTTSPTAAGAATTVGAAGE